MASKVLDLEASNKRVKADFNEDLLLLILLLLPPNDIFRLRCVSKTWNNIISSPFFLQSYHRKVKDSQCLLALVAVTKRNQNLDSLRTSKILPLVRINHDFKTDILLSGEFGHFINSSNGLTLWYNDTTCICKILNPLTGRAVSLLDMPRKTDQLQCLALVCEKSEQELVPSYKVLVVNERVVDKTLIVNTYSSKTSNWTSSAVMVKEDVSLWQRPSLVVNGIVYWRAYDSNAGQHLIVYDSSRGHIQLIKLPGGDYKRFQIARSGGDGDLWIGAHENTDVTNILNFWMLPKGGTESSSTSEWILKYNFSHAVLVKDINSAMEKENGEMELGVSVGDDIWFEAFIPGKPHIAVLRTNQRIFLYNTENKSVEEVEFHGGHSFPGGLSSAFPYMKPFCLSSYAL